MIYYLNNEDKFLLFITPITIIFVHYCSAKEGPTRADLRWKERNLFKSNHMAAIVKFLQSDDQANRNVGLKMLEQTLKIVINGEVVGNSDEQSI